MLLRQYGYPLREPEYFFSDRKFREHEREYLAHILAVYLRAVDERYRNSVFFFERGGEPFCIIAYGLSISDSSFATRSSAGI